MTSMLICPICTSPLQQHQASQGFYCENKHHYDRHKEGYWPLLLVNKTKMQAISREKMRAKRFLLASGIYSPVVDKIAQVLLTLLVNKPELQHLDYQCGDGYYLRALMPNLSALNAQHWGIDDSENTLFAASKAGTAANLLLSGLKKLPIADNSVDVITILDSPLKGKECQRVLKDDGILVMLIPAERHLWQLKQQVYSDLVEKQQEINLPKNIQVIESHQIKFTQDVDGQQAITLLDMSSFGWRANDELRHGIKTQQNTHLEFEFNLVIAKKQG
ncbi:putative RNA methyltransferase [Shewanella sp. SR44-3]|uniref:putative RNA methyltransferase n=1 Tax=Shewanella sp. SR44-3 TaxID=2760936 RepID=UPI0015FB21AA|nr:methyltransferase domain-containing protein [Shewanella sp. SR44-3]MBB1270879.1 methyltransferase domain-containing protein [Shewanella sp. SR44-3]